MAKTLTIQLSDELESKLTAQAQKLNLSLEDLILQSLSQSAKQENISEFDPISPLLGIAIAKVVRTNSIIYE